MHLFTTVVQPLWALPQFLSQINKKEAVEYRYWLGRYKLSAGNVHHVSPRKEGTQRRLGSDDGSLLNV